MSTTAPDDAELQIILRTHVVHPEHSMTCAVCDFTFYPCPTRRAIEELIRVRPLVEHLQQYARVDALTVGKLLDLHGISRTPEIRT